TYSVAPILLPSTLAQPPGCECDVYGPNNAGQVVGFVYNGSFNVGPNFIATTSGYTLLPLPAHTIATALNNFGQVTGSFDFGLSSIGQQPQAFIGSTAGYTLIPLPPGATATTGIALNDPSQVGGEASAPNTGAPSFPFIGTSSNTVTIPPPPGWNPNLELQGINNSGEVVGEGYRSTDSNSIAPYVGTTSGSMPISLPPGWITISAVFRINDSGEVAGYGNNGGVYQSFVSTPAATTALLMLSGASACYVSLGHDKAINDSGALWVIATLVVHESGTSVMASSPSITSFRPVAH
ncbi:MAG TPA: hypothetical protein VKV15_13570, partial [Bryobacteraceae bacterium]|nr:hypothetical protein [Bryobacteraceae bacterium]